jgi:hypothetical protein
MGRDTGKARIPGSEAFDQGEASVDDGIEADCQEVRAVGAEPDRQFEAAWFCGLRRKRHVVTT